MQARYFSYVIVAAGLLLLAVSCGNERQEINNSSPDPLPADTSAQDKTATTTETKQRPVLPEIKTERGLLRGSWAEANRAHPVFYSRRVDEWAHQNPAAPDPKELVPQYVHDYIGHEKLDQLYARELIYYCLAYPASYTQICAEPSGPSPYKDKAISGHLRSRLEGVTISHLQKKALENKRDSVILELNRHLRSRPESPVPYLDLLLQLDAVESIPVVADLASTEQTGYYSFMLELLHRHHHDTLLKWKYYDQLYGNRSWQYASTIPATAENAGLIIKMAHELRNMKKK